MEGEPFFYGFCYIALRETIGVEAYNFAEVRVFGQKA